MDSFKSIKDASAIANFLRELSCCRRCTLRFLGLKLSENESAYKDPKDYLDRLMCNSTSIKTEVDLPESFAKKLKSNICPVCLDCFKQKTVEKLTESFGSLNIESYNYKNFFFNVSFPKCLALRSHAMLLHLKQHFPNFPFGDLYDKKTEQVENVVLEQPHKIFRATATEVLSKALHKQYHPKSNLSLLIIIGYENDESEVEKVKHIINSKPSKKNTNGLSRNIIYECLKNINDKLFREKYSLPPDIPDKGVLLEKVEITADPIYLGGRYLKFKRNVGQTPWIIDGVSVAEHNVQDIIFDAIFNVLNTKNSMTFTASGREDVDVRMLGTGRPFYIKIDNPKERQFSKGQLLDIERQVVETGLAAVIKLQTIYASDLVKIKFGEEKKKKTYKALCTTTAPTIKEVVSIINKQEFLHISQLTVMRVLHRRTLMAREKIIYHMSANEVPGHDNLFELEITTQAGTYVKEFIHGDFERTRPSISSIIGYPADLVALDCIDIDLVWP